MRRATLLLLLLLLGGVATAQPRSPATRADPCAPRPQLYLSAMGEPFRAPPDQPYPVARWFAGADRDGDGRLAMAEFLSDAERLFTALDGDRDGEIEPLEVAAYETDMAPEIRLYQRGGGSLPRPGERPRERDEEYGGAMGAGRFAQLNLPQPVASADLDFNRGVTREEWRTVAGRRFLLLGAVDGALTLAALKPTPAQEDALVCAAMAAKKRR